MNRQTKLGTPVWLPSQCSLGLSFSPFLPRFYSVLIFAFHVVTLSIPFFFSYPLFLCSLLLVLIHFCFRRCPSKKSPLRARPPFFLLLLPFLWLVLLISQNGAVVADVSALVMESMPNGDLFSLVSANGPLNEIIARTYFHQLIDGGNDEKMERIRRSSKKRKGLTCKTFVEDESETLVVLFSSCSSPSPLLLGRNHWFTDCIGFSL